MSKTEKVTPAEKRIRAVMVPFIKKQKKGPYGFAFLHVVLHNGVRFCMSANLVPHNKIIAKAEEQVGVKYAYINLD